MPADCYAFGEILWDCLPSGKQAGGAPFNVAAHLAQIGVRSGLISCVGRDALGDELLAVARDKRVDREFVTRSRSGLPTGTVIVTLDENRNPSYEVVQPAAWNEIRVSPEAFEAVSKARAFVYGSLAAHSRNNREQLEKLLDLKQPLKFFDVNLRPPFVDLPVVLDLAQRANVVKLNVAELAHLAPVGESLDSDAAISRACEALAETTGVARICVTRAEQGAGFWDHGCLTSVPAPTVEVRDTVGAGDAFMAGLVVGLTNGSEARKVLDNACQVGAYVAAQCGATPVLPNELTAPIRQE